MSKHVLKGFKSLKLAQSLWKKTDETCNKENKKKKLNYKGLKKLLPIMGNLTSHNRHNHHRSIENVDDHATRLMENLNQLREEKVSCDITFNENSVSAHKIVVSFNKTLYDMANSSSEAIAVTIDGSDVIENVFASATNESEKTEENVGDINQVSSTHGSNTDVSELNDHHNNEEGLVAQLQTCNGDLMKEQEAHEINKDEENLQSNSPNNDSTEDNCAESQQKSDDAGQQKSDDADENNGKEDESTETIGVPLSSELIVNGTADTNDTPSEEVAITIDNEPSIATPFSLADPIEILVNFFYTSHIDITQKNVSSLRVVAALCKLEDVVTACNEFEKVLHMETKSLATDEEKDTVATQFRYRYSDPAMPSKMLQHFAKLRKENKFTDAVVKSSSGMDIPNVHSLVLASGTNFFQVVKSATSELQILEASEIDESALTLLIDFLYTGRVDVTSHTVSKLMQGSDCMQLQDVTEGCAEFLESTISVQNCIQHHYIGVQYKCERLKEVSLQFIAEHFSNVVQTESFLTLSVDDLLEIIKSDNLHLTSPLAVGEMAVYNAVRRWINHDEVNRKQNLVDVMSGVRFALIAQNHLVDDITTDMLVISNDEMCSHINDLISSKSSMCISEEVSMRGSNYIATIGGSYPIYDLTSEERGYQAVGYSNQFTVFDYENGIFHELTTMPETKALHCVVACDQFVYVVGGFDSYSCIVNSVYCFDLSQGTWHIMPNMKVKRSCFSLHVVAGYIFAVGGLTPNGYTATVERLDRKRNVWELCSSMPCTKYRHAGCVLKEEILISGGYEKQDSVFSYNPDNDSWKKEIPMNVGRDSHAMEANNEKAYVIGGDGIQFSVELYQNKTWTLVLHPYFDMQYLYLPGSAVVDEKIYLLGGWQNENVVVESLRYFDTKLGEWVITDTEMPIPRGSAASCVIKMPKNYWKMKWPVSK